MKALFLESYAAGQIAKYAQVTGLDDDGLADLLQRAYDNGRLHGNHLGGGTVEEYENEWVSMCLLGDRHKDVSIDGLMIWANTPEGKPFWHGVNRFMPRQE